MMSSNQRDSSRIGLVIDIKLTCKDNREHILKSRNISDKGVFLEFNDEKLDIPIGTNVTLQVCSQLGDEPAPPVEAEVMRTTDEGIGLQFIL